MLTATSCARTLLCLVLWSASGATAATSALLLGVDYSEWLSPNAVQIATDRSGALYVLSAVRRASPPPPSSVTKLSADGKTVLWQNNPGFAVQTMTVNCLSWPVADADLAVFTVDGVYAAALNQDGTINSAKNPAALGTIVSVFATGLGPIFPAQADGTLVGLPLPYNVLPVGVEARYVTDIFLHPGSTPFEVMYAGPAPYLVAGVSQINFKVVQYPVQQGQMYLVRPSGISPGFRIYLTGQ